MINDNAADVILGFLSEEIYSSYASGFKKIAGAIKKDAKKFRQQFGKDKLYNIDFTKEDLIAMRNFEMEAFTVANIGSYELNEELKQLALKDWNDFGAFELAARQKMLQYGIGLGDQPPTGWLQNSLNTAKHQSYSASQWIKVNDPEITDMYPAWRYFTRHDSKVRASHAALDGKVFMKNDPITNKILPIIDYNCRCGWEPIPVYDLDKYQIPGRRTKAQEQGLLEGVNKDFAFNPGDAKSIWKNWLRSKMDGLDSSTLSELKKKIREYAKTISEDEIYHRLKDQ